MSLPQPPVEAGPRSYRKQIRRFGPLAALVVPVILVLSAAAIFTAVPCSGRACIVRHGPGWALGAMGAPTGVLVGLPWTHGPIPFALALLTSIGLWVGIGRWAAIRATRSPVADWADWRREYWWLVIPLWIGAGVAAVALAAAVALR
jgi:hypothetical protein